MVHLGVAGHSIARQRDQEIADCSERQDSGEREAKLQTEKELPQGNLNSGKYENTSRRFDDAI